MATLRKHAKCPIHGKLYGCCGRAVKPNFGPVRMLEDTNGDKREVCSPAELRRRKTILIAQQKNRCALCGELFDDFRDVEVDHILPRGMGGGRRDDSWGNIQAVHARCNFEKGSKRT